MVAEKVNSVRSSDFNWPRRKISEAPERVISPVPSTNSPSRAPSRNSQANDTVTAIPCSTGGCDRKEAIVGERHEAAAMDVVRAVEMLFLNAEGTADGAVLLHPVPERSIMGFEIVAAEGAPAGKFALGADTQIGAVQKSRFGQVVQAGGLYLGNKILKSDPRLPCKPACLHGLPAKLWTGRKRAVKALFRPRRSP